MSGNTVNTYDHLPTWPSSEQHAARVCLCVTESEYIHVAYIEFENVHRPREYVSRYRQQRMNLFQVPLLAEYMEESLILIRQTICWKTVR